MDSSGKRIAALIVVGVLILSMLGGCTGAAGSQTQPEQMPPACDSNALILPESVVTGSDKISHEEASRRYRERHAAQSNWLSLHIAVAASQFQYNEPIPFRLTIANETDQPVIFFRPGRISLGGNGVVHSDLIVTLTSSGEEIAQDVVLVNIRLPPAKREDFTVLPPGESCVMGMQLMWNETVDSVRGPFPPGDYELSIVMQGRYLGPRNTGADEFDVYDVGGWRGTTSPSNEVTFTIVPPGE